MTDYQKFLCATAGVVICILSLMALNLYLAVKHDRVLQRIEQLERNQ